LKNKILRKETYKKNQIEIEKQSIKDLLDKFDTAKIFLVSKTIYQDKTEVMRIDIKI